MRTAEEIENEIDGNIEYLVRLQDKISQGRKSDTETKRNKAEFNRVLKENALLREILFYLKTNPREEFIVSERDKIQKILQAKNEQFLYWKKNVCPADVPEKKIRSHYNKEQGILFLQKQLKTLNLILNIH